MEALSCPSCSAGFDGADGETVIDAGASDNGTSIASETPLKTNAFAEGVSDLSLLTERTDEEIDHLTSVVPRVGGVTTPFGGSSSDPPTRFLRGIEQHIELPGGSVVDDYEIDAKLGAGAMGVVYGARHLRLGRRVAIKVIAPTMGTDLQALARFEREAKALASLQHPNIVDVYAFGTLPDQRSYFVMEYLVGETLDERLERRNMPLDEALDIIDQIARALEAAHAQGIVHRDLKPSNTFLVRLPREQRSVVKLLDFGLIKLVIADGVENTASGAVIGTSLYLSPEQARSPNVDARTDIYALGCIAYELVLGRHPFHEAQTPTAAIAAHLTELPPQPRTIWPGIPVPLDLLMFSMLAKDSSYRPTLSQVRSVIASVRSPTTSVRAMHTPSSSVTRRALYLRAWITALVTFAFVVGGVIGARVFGSPSDHRDEPESVATNPRDRNEVPVPVQPNPPRAVVRTPVIDAGVLPANKPETTTKPTKPRVVTGDVAGSKGAAVSGEVSSPSVAVDAGIAQENGPVPEVPKPQVTPKLQVTPATIERPIQRPVPSAPSKPPGRSDRNDTLNPFRKRGSASR